MFANSQNHASDHLPPDIFDMEDLARTDAAAGEAGGLPNEGSQTDIRIAARAKKAKPIHFGLGAIAIAMVWISWPYVFPKNLSTTQSASRLMLSAAPAPLPRITPTPAKQIASPAGKKLVDDYASPPPFARPLALEMPPIVPQSKPSARRAQTVSRGAKHTDATIGPATTKFSLNTVYRGQAWIQDEERTYVVQAGDMVHGIVIVSIDARERRVVTSQGVIR